MGNSTPAKPRRGRPEFIFTDDMFPKIEAFSMLGRGLDAIARLIGCSEATLERAHKADKQDPPKYGGKLKEALLKGREYAEAAVDKAYFDSMTIDRNPSTLIFYKKVRQGWKEPKSELEVSSPGGAPLVQGSLTAKDRKLLQDFAKHKARALALGGDAGPAPVDAPKNKKGR